MNIEIINLKDSFQFLLIQDYLTKEELDGVWDELAFLSYKNKFNKNDQGVARENDFTPKANRNTLWLDEVYRDKKYSNFFQVYTRWSTENNIYMLTQNSIIWNLILSIKKDDTVLSYYEDKNYYKEHRDSSKLTQLYYIFKEPKKFSGGELVFEDFNYVQEIKNNSLIIFPGFYAHKVNSVNMFEEVISNKNKFSCSGRYVFTTFFS